MSQCTQLNIIILVKIFFALFNAIESHNPIFGKPYLQDNEAFHETIDTSVAETDIVSSADFFRNVHTMMTPNELFLTFGTNDGTVPDYKVFSMNLRPSRKKRQTDDKIKLTVEIDNRIINLNLIATDGHLASKNTPVWFAHTYPTAYNRIRYDPYPGAMKNIEEFRMYQDLKNKAAITVYTDPEHNSILEGIVTSRYAIKSLPIRLSLEIIKKTNQYFVETPTLRKRSIQPDVDDITGHFVLYKLKQDVNSTLISTKFKPREKRRSPIGDTRQIPETVYPEILLVLEHDIMRKRSITQALQFVLAFWNGVDMIYSAINKPKIRLFIAGIIISLDDRATPYIARDTSFNVIARATRITKQMGLHFYEEKDRFPHNLYDIIFAMTTMKLCDDELKPCIESLGYATLGRACQWRYNDEPVGTMRSAGIVNYNRMYGAVDLTAQQIAYLFGVPQDKTNGFSSKCNEQIKEQKGKISRNNFTWSQCSKASFRRFFSLKVSQCLDNKPIPIELTDNEFLAGQLITLDGQCRNNGFYEVCKLPGVSSCDYQACKARGSNQCVERAICPLPGSECDAYED